MKNVIFDMGNVLIRWDPEGLARRAGAEGEDAALLAREVCGREEWTMLDRGTMTEEEALARVRARLPEGLRDLAVPMIWWWRDPLWPIEGMGELVREVKAAGRGVYLLSNASAALHRYFCRIPGWECFDGLLVSADHRLLKPERAIYELLYRTFSLDPAECFFIDDSPANVRAAQSTGMEGVVFDGDLAKLKKVLWSRMYDTTV